MRQAMFLVASLVVVATFAGCLGSDDEANPPPADTEAAAPEPVPEPPAPIHEEGSVLVSLPILGLLGQGSCRGMASGTCFWYPFEVEGTVRMDAVLEWGRETNDFDLFLLQDGTQTASSEDVPPGTSESLGTALSPGSYELGVVAFVAVADSFVLHAEFESAPAPPG